MTLPIILIFGDDKLSSSIINSLNIPDNIILIKDKSSNLKRIFRLLIRGSISISFLLKTLYCQIKQKSINLDKKFINIKNNEVLAKIILQVKPEYVFLFRAGLIINKKVIDLGVPLVNIHCASLNGFGGLGSIDKALTKEVYNQVATAHIVTNKIDQGKIIAEIPFKLNKNKNYCSNELIAYRTGGKLLQMLIDKELII